MLHELLGEHELLRLVEGALARGGVEVVRRFVVRPALHRLRLRRACVIGWDRGGQGRGASNMSCSSQPEEFSQAPG